MMIRYCKGAQNMHGDGDKVDARNDELLPVQAAGQEGDAPARARRTSTTDVTK